MSRAIAAALALSLAVPALAQDPAPAEEPEVRHKLVTEIDFELRELRASVAGPELEWISARTPATFRPLVEVREDFDQAMRASVDEVR